MTCEFSWKVGDLPFIWGPLKRPTNGGDLPDRLPFEVSLHPETGILIQKKSREVSRALSLAYRRGSTLTGMMDEEGIGRQYAEDFLRFILTVRPAEALRGCRILEVGCGTGYLLSRLKAYGAEVTGVEPGQHGQGGSKKFDVPIVSDFFPSPSINGQFDVILMYAVLEHIDDQSDFLDHVSRHLEKNGVIILSVPNCEPYVRTGDLSVLLHEHWSYFEMETLKRALLAVRPFNVRIENARIGDCLYAAAALDDKPGRISGKPPDSKEAEALVRRAERFRDLALVAVARLAEYLHAAERSGEALGIYVPSRVINSLVLAGFRSQVCRFFDDNALLHDTYFPGVPIRIESRKELMERPVDQLLIMSRAFGERIIQNIAPHLMPTTRIKTWEHFFS